MGEEILAAEAARNDYAIAWSARGNPAQSALLECPIFEVFFGGARGGGKTDGMLGEWVRHAGLYGEHAIGLMLRRTLHVAAVCANAREAEAGKRQRLSRISRRAARRLVNLLMGYITGEQHQRPFRWIGGLPAAGSAAR